MKPAIVDSSRAVVRPMFSLTVAHIRDGRAAVEELSSLLEAAAEGNFDDDFEDRARRVFHQLHALEAYINEVSNGA